MEPTSPVLPGFKHREVIYGKSQPAYMPLPSLKGLTPEWPVLTRWKFNDAERIAIMNGEDLYLTVYTFGMALQPLKLEVGDMDTDSWEKAASVGLTPEDASS